MTTLEGARVAFAQHAWGEAFEAFTDARTPLDAADAERLAVSAYLIGADDASVAAWEAAQRAALRAGDPAESARYAFWLAFCLLLGGRMAHAGGWLARAEGLVAAARQECPAAGYLLVPSLLQALGSGDPGRARDLAIRATDVGERFGDADLRALGVVSHGQALLAGGDLAGGMARLDAAMVSVTANEVGPITSGIVYCAVIAESMRVFDLRRAAEWTDTLSSWCAAQPDLVPFRGQCLVHRSQLQRAAGSWPEAVATARDACARLTDPPHPALGEAYYQQGELHRLVGLFPEAEIAYRQAGRHGRHPMPGLALLALGRGDAAAAVAAIRRALQETPEPLERPALLSAAVDILGSTGAWSDARAAAEELTAVAVRSPSPALHAMAAHATGAVLVAAGDPAAALVELRRAATAWQSLRMPYEAARTAVLLGRACWALGDRTAAALELDNATDAFRALAARPDIDHVAAVRNDLAAGAPDPADGDARVLSAREREVLRHVAAGETNRQIAERLRISQHTVSRHLENIFAKLGVTSRAAATAHAYEQHLL